MRRSPIAIVLACAGTLALPTLAAASVQTGGTTDTDAAPADAGLDIVKASASHDTAGGTSVAITLKGSPSVDPGALLTGVVGVADSSGVCNGRVQLGAFSDPASDFTVGSTIDDADTATTVAVTRTISGTTVTLSTTASRPGGGAVDCGFVRTTSGVNSGKAVVDRATFVLSGPAPTPTPDPAPAPAPKPAPPAPATAVVGAPKGATAYKAPKRAPSLTKAGRSAVYGICGPSICRVDPISKKRTVVRKGTKKQGYDAVSTSVSGSVLAFERGTDVWKGGRDGKGAKELDKGDTPVVRPDGGSVAWYGLRTVAQGPICSGGAPYAGGPVVCYPQAPLQVPTAYYSVGTKTHVHQGGVTSPAWLAGNLVLDRRPDGGSERSYWSTSADGALVQPVAQEQGRSLNDAAGSPDGRSVVASSEPTPADPKAKLAYKGRISLYDARTGRKVRDLTSGKTDSGPIFSPDGKHVAFNRGGSVRVVPTKGGKVRTLAKGLALTGPSWSLTR